MHCYCDLSTRILLFSDRCGDDFFDCFFSLLELVDFDIFVGFVASGRVARTEDDDGGVSLGICRTVESNLVFSSMGNVLGE